MRACIHYKDYSIRTEKAHVHWVRAFIRLQGMCHRHGMGAEELQAPLRWLANDRAGLARRSVWPRHDCLFGDIGGVGRSHRSGNRRGKASAVGLALKPVLPMRERRILTRRLSSA
ncbi:phage integrase N-terminal SAM-like domain-containing protein [Pseudothauera lacus]|uniref:phage integrase N-terminal SAM-like domain-containing protein n=1 Tax=Pseudothauera lacus TaxID=2136175 RepID=UPI0038B630B2